MIAALLPRRPSDPDPPGLNDSDATRQSLEVTISHKQVNESTDRQQPETPGSEQYNSRVGAGRILANVAKLHIESQQHTRLSLCSRAHDRIRLGQEAFIFNCADIMLQIMQGCLKASW